MCKQKLPPKGRELSLLLKEYGYLLIVWEAPICPTGASHGTRTVPEEKRRLGGSYVKCPLLFFILQGKAYHSLDAVEQTALIYDKLCIVQLWSDGAGLLLIGSHTKECEYTRSL